MILSYLTHKKWQFDSAGMKILATKSPVAYRDLVQGFQGKKQTIICSSDDYETLEISKMFNFVGDPLLSGDIMTKYMCHIIESYVTNLDEKNRNKILTAFHNLESTLQDSLLLKDLPLEINFDEDLKKLLKMVGLHLDHKMLLEPYDIIEMVLKVLEICNLKTIPVMCNVANYLDSQQLNELSKLVRQMNLILVLIEFTDSNFKFIPENAQFYYIDEDLVDWY